MQPIKNVQISVKFLNYMFKYWNIGCVESEEDTCDLQCASYTESR